ncbi:MAG: ribose-5-phosphate isomerase RpiA [Pseudomonadota bacterium]
MSHDDQKREAAAAAADLVTTGMRVGLGTGSTAAHFVQILGERVVAGLDIIAVPTSQVTGALAEACGIRLTTLDETPELDICVDGADEIGPGLALIKGGGGALLREKIVAQSAHKMVVIADETKVVETLGQFPLPVEVLPFGATATVHAMKRALERHRIDGAVIARMAAGAPYETDNGNLIFDCYAQRIADPAALAHDLSGIAGVVEHGLFIDMAESAIIAGAEGIEHLAR